MTPDPFVGSDSASRILIPAVALALGLAVAAALLAPSGRWRWTSLAASALACVGIAATGLAVLATGEVAIVRWGSLLGLALVDLRIDGLSALFLVILGGVGAATSIFGIGYEAAGHEPGRVAAAYPVFLASLGLVFGAANAVAFLFAWELMALSSAALVVGARPDAGVARAGYTYLVLTHLATAAIVVAFGILAGEAGSLELADFPAAAIALPAGVRDVVFVLLVVGFGTKAGAIPFHIWLPRAHPVAPSHVSALMSGVMIKAGIYGLVRFGLEILGPGPEWWGLAVLAIGVASAVLGVLYALMEHDLKRLLAFHSIENIGIILIGLGVAVLAAGRGAFDLAGLALAAALFHSLNHALFKSALFLAAGSVQRGVGHRDLNLLGGLARRMPITTLAFLVGAAAISGLPPLNGFASEWLTFQGLLGAGADPMLSPLARSASLLAVAGLGLTAALAVACFVKATGIGFLALPRSAAAAAAAESGRTMLAGLVALAGACVAVGLAAGPLAERLRHIAVEVLDGRPEPTLGGVAGPALPGLVGLGGGAYGALVLALAIAAVAVVAWLLVRRGRSVRRTDTWTCGVAPEPAYEYTATSFAKLIRLYFGSILRPVREVAVEYHPGTPFPRTVRYHGHARHVLDERIYEPLHRLAVAVAQLARRLQAGSLQLYLAYGVAALVILLVVAR